MEPTDQQPPLDGGTESLGEALASQLRLIAMSDDFSPLHCRTLDVWMAFTNDLSAGQDAIEAALRRLDAEAEADDVRRKIEVGLRQHEAGKTLTHGEAQKRLGKWLNRPDRTEEPKK